MPNIVFTTRLTEADWDDTLRGWRCPPLAVPGAVVDALYVEGNKVDSASYEVLSSPMVIRWSPVDQPQRATASIKLTEALTLGAETDRWKRLAIVLPVVATIASAAISSMATIYSRAGSDKRPLGPSQSVGIAPATPTPPPKEPSSQQASTHSVEISGGTSFEKAAEVALGQSVRGYAEPDGRWFKFSIAEKGPTQVRVTLHNLNRTGDMWVNAYDASRHRIGWLPFVGAEQNSLRFTSPEPSEYYVALTQGGQGIAVHYNMVVTTD